MITIAYESHATTFDNEQKIASGHHDVALSPKGVEEAKKLGERRAGEHFDAIFTSDMQRAYNTAKLAFGDKFPIITDARLRECDYGGWEGRPSAQVNAERAARIKEPFPGGESYTQCSQRMKAFLQDLQKDYAGKRVLVIGHRATQYGLDQWVNGLSLEQTVVAPWEWQPGWEYQLDESKPL